MLNAAMGLFGLIPRPVEDTAATLEFRERIGTLLGVEVEAVERTFDSSTTVYTSMIQIPYLNGPNHPLIAFLEQDLGMVNLPVIEGRNMAKVFDPAFPGSTGRITCANELLYHFGPDLNLPFTPL